MSIMRREKDGVDENNSVNEMQEYLQLWCPTSRCETLWRYDEGNNTQGPFRVRIMLLNTGSEMNTDWPMPFSGPFGKKKQAQKEAARLCLEWLHKSGERPHDPTWLPLMVREGSSSGSYREGNERVRVFFSDHIYRIW